MQERCGWGCSDEKASQHWPFSYGIGTVLVGWVADGCDDVEEAMVLLCLGSRHTRLFFVQIDTLFGPGDGFSSARLFFGDVAHLSIAPG